MRKWAKKKNTRAERKFEAAGGNQARKVWRGKNKVLEGVKVKIEG